jgi:hypothetical protein
MISFWFHHYVYSATHHHRILLCYLVTSVLVGSAWQLYGKCTVLRALLVGCRRVNVTN